MNGLNRHVSSRPFGVAFLRSLFGIDWREAMTLYEEIQELVLGLIWTAIAVAVGAVIGLLSWWIWYE